MLKLLKKLKLYTKLISETVKYSHQNLFVIICGLPSPKKNYFAVAILQKRFCRFICKINNRSGNARGSIKCPYFAWHCFTHFKSAVSTVSVIFPFKILKYIFLEAIWFLCLLFFLFSKLKNYVFFWKSWLAE